VDRNIVTIADPSLEARERDASVAATPRKPSRKQPTPPEKLLKYFPEAALALYVALDPLVREAFDGDAFRVAIWASLGISMLFCWLYLKRIWHVERTLQILVSIGALVLYVAAIGGPFSTISGYKTIYGTIAAIIATAFLLFMPAPDPQ
jgi:hypothetical protein